MKIKFNRRKITKIQTLGENLKNLRQKAGLSLEEVSQDLKIQKEYLKALEESRYADLPGEVFVRNFLKAYAEYLGLDPKRALDFYSKERKAFLNHFQRPSLLERLRHPREILTPKIIMNILGGIILLAILTYVGLNLKTFFKPPYLEILSPVDNLITNTPQIEIKGFTDKEAKVLINGREVFTSPKGEFKETIVLKPGLNYINIEAIKEKGRKSNQVIKVFYKTP